MATTELKGAASPRTSRWRGQWDLDRSRELLFELVRRELRSHHRGTSLGALWSLLNPLLFMIIYTLVFSHFMRFSIPGVAYPVYLLAGLLTWNFFGQAVSFAGGSVVGNASLVKKVAFPWALLPLSAVLSAFVNYCISLALLVPLLLLYHVGVGVQVLLVPLLALLTFVLALGLGLLVAAGNVYFRDVEYLLGITLQVGFFLTPIIYSLDFVASRTGTFAAVARWIVYANPMTWVTVAFQDVVARDYHAIHQPLGLLYATAFGLAMFALGAWAFGRSSRHFAEEL